MSKLLTVGSLMMAALSFPTFAQSAVQCKVVHQSASPEQQTTSSSKSRTKDILQSLARTEPNKDAPKPELTDVLDPAGLPEPSEQALKAAKIADRSLQEDHALAQESLRISKAEIKEAKEKQAKQKNLTVEQVLQLRKEIEFKEKITQYNARRLARLEKWRDIIGGLFGFGISTQQTFRREMIRSFRMAIQSGNHDLAIRLIRQEARHFEENYLALAKIDADLAEIDKSLQRDPSQLEESKSQIQRLRREQIAREQDLGRNIKLYTEVRRITEDAMTSMDIDINKQTKDNTDTHNSFGTNPTDSAAETVSSDPSVSAAAKTAKVVYSVIFEKSVLKKLAPGSKDIGKKVPMSQVQQRFNKSPEAVIAQLRHHLRQEIVSLTRYYSSILLRVLTKSPDALPVWVKNGKLGPFFQYFIGPLYDANCRVKFIGKIEDVVDAYNRDVSSPKLLTFLRSLSAGSDQTDFLITMARTPFAQDAWNKILNDTATIDPSFREVLVNAQTEARKKGDLAGRVLVNRFSQWTVGALSISFVIATGAHETGLLEHILPQMDAWIVQHANYIDWTGKFIGEVLSGSNPAVDQ